MPLFWGEVNPLAFVRDAFQEAGTAAAPAVVILSLPTRQDGQQRRMHGECEAVGAAVDGWVGASGRRVGVLISADLAHTHPSEHHLPGYTLGPGAQPFASMSPSSPPTLLAFCPTLRVLLFTHRSEAFWCGACAVSAPGAAAGYDAAVSDWAATLRPSALLVSFFGREAFLAHPFLRAPTKCPWPGASGRVGQRCPLRQPLRLRRKPPTHSKLAQRSFQATTIFEQILHHLVTRDGRRFVASPEAHEYRAPMYFGMLVASMRPAPPRL